MVKLPAARVLKPYMRQLVVSKVQSVLQESGPKSKLRL